MRNSLINLKRTNTVLYCRHWIEAVNFYKKQLRISVAFGNDWFVEFKLIETSFLSIVNSARATISDVQGPGVTLTWEVIDFNKIKEHLEKQGIATTPIQRKWGTLALYRTDPEGHRLEFWQKRTERGAA